MLYSTLAGITWRALNIFDASASSTNYIRLSGDAFPASIFLKLPSSFYCAARVGTTVSSCFCEAWCYDMLCMALLVRLMFSFLPGLNRAYCSMQILLLKPHNNPVGLVQLSTLPSFLQTRKLRFRKVRRLLKCTKLVRGQAES